MSFFDRLSGYGYICGHRGARSIAPENTLVALEEARRCGADLWEADVQFTADGEPVIFHDDLLGRTTNVDTLTEFAARKPWPLAEFTLAEVQRLNAGAWFVEDDPYGTIASGEVGSDTLPQIERQRISRLEDVLLYCRRHDFPFNLEIKDQQGRIEAATVAAAVLEQLRRCDAEGLVLVSSFNHAYLRHLKRMSAAVDTAALVEGEHPPKLIDYLKDLDVVAYHPDWQIADVGLIARLNEVGIRTNLWTVNDMERAREFIVAGAGFICPDWPQKLVKARHSA